MQLTLLHVLLLLVTVVVDAQADVVGLHVVVFASFNNEDDYDKTGDEDGGLACYA